MELAGRQIEGKIWEERKRTGKGGTVGLATQPHSWPWSGSKGKIT